MSELPKPKEFQEITDQKEARSALKQAAKFFSTALVWTKNQQITFNTHIADFNETVKSIHLALPQERDFDPAAFSKTLLGSDSPDVFFNISFSHANIFFKAEFVGHDAKGLRFRLPEKVFKVQRRKDMRVTLRNDLSMTFQFEDPRIPQKMESRRVYDVSAGGLSFIVARDEKSKYPVGLILNDVSVTINGRKISCHGEVRYCRTLPETTAPDSLKIGIHFKGIRAADTQHIASFVFDETRKYYSKFI